VLKLLYQGTEVVQNTSSAANFGIWSPNSDAMFYFGNNPKNESRRVYRDGTNVHISHVGGNGNTFTFDCAPETEAGIVVHDTIRNGFYELHPKTWTPNLQKPFTSNVSASSAGEGLYLRNRAGVMKYYEQFARGYRVRNITTDAIEDTVEIFASGANLSLPIQFVNNQTVAVFRLTGEMALWDLDTQTMLLNSYIDIPHTAAIDSQYQTVVSIRNSDKTVQIYALEIEPHSFSALSATPGNYDRYHDEELSITVLGSNSEPVPNVEVHWAVQTIVSGSGGVNQVVVNGSAVNAGASFAAAKGKITPAVSITNASGVATATYCPPGLDWITGDQETITAKVYI